MIAACTQRIKELLLASGVPERAIGLDATAESRHVVLPSAVICAGIDKVTPSGRLVSSELDAEAGVRRYVTKRSERDLAFGLIVHHKTQAAAETITTAVLHGLLDGFEHEGQPIGCHTSSTDWLKERSVSSDYRKAVVAFTFEGGIYRTREVPVLQDLRTEGERLT